MPAFMRFIKSEAGHIEKLYFAVKAASMVPSNDPTSQRELFLRLWNKAHPEAKRKIESIRSAESHLSFARELGLLTQRDQNRSWQLTNSFGRSFLILYEKYHRVPKNLLLASFMLNDKDILAPYLGKVLKRRFESHELLFQEAWHEFYNRYKSSLVRIEPTVPANLELRTCRHHVEARDKFLMRSSGIGLNVDNLVILCNWLQNPNLQDDLFLASSESISGSRATELNQGEIIQMLSEYHRAGSVMGFASVKGAWAFTNELSLPSFYSKWSTILNLIQKSEPFMTQPSYDAEDRLYSVRERTAGMQHI
jgi:hypothetical protein